LDLFLDLRVSQDLADEAKNLTPDNPSAGRFQRQSAIRTQPPCLTEWGGNLGDKSSGTGQDAIA
jgi:hypothetical protein